MTYEQAERVARGHAGKAIFAAYPVAIILAPVKRNATRNYAVVAESETRRYVARGWLPCSTFARDVDTGRVVEVHT